MLSSAAVKLGPLEYLYRDGTGVQFTPHNFPDLWLPLMAAATVLLVAQIVLYNVRARQLHRFEPLRTLQEWLLWTGLITFGLILVEGIFAFYFLFVLGTIVVGLAVMVWIRFFHFPPMIAAYNEQLRRQRFFGEARHKAAEATIRRRARGQRVRKR
jgi:hypothetical protein